MALKASVDYDTKKLAAKIRAIRDGDTMEGDLDLSKWNNELEKLKEQWLAREPDEEDDGPTPAELKKAGRDDNTQKIHELELHDKWWVEGYEVLRFPGGWIYDRKNGPVFVPLSDEGSKEIKL